MIGLLVGNIDFFDMITGILQGDTLLPCMYIICLNYILRTLIDLMKENGLILKKKKKKARSGWYLAEIIIHTSHADNLLLLANTPAQTEALLQSLKPAANSIVLYLNVNDIEFMCFKQKVGIFYLSRRPIELADKFIYLDSNILSTERSIEKARTVIDRLSILRKSDNNLK